MKLYEFEEQDLEGNGRYDASEDKLGSYTLGDTRKPVLTLRGLNKLKKMRAMHKLENLKREDIVSMMYSPPAEEAGGGMGGF